jgi:hypothetical protein
VRTIFAGGSGKPREFNHLPNNRFDSHSGDEDRVFARNLCGCGQQARLEGASYTAALFAEAASAATVCQPATASPYSICCLLDEHLKLRLQCAALLWQSDERARGETAMKIEYISCAACNRPSGLAVATGILISDCLPDPFEATCPHCGRLCILPASCIETIDIADLHESADKAGSAANLPPSRGFN